MAFHVVNRDDRAVPGQSEAVCHAAAHHQSADQARARRVGDGIGPVDIGLGQHLLDQRQQAPYMVARSDFRHDTAVNGVQVDLAVQGVGQQPVFAAVQRHASLVAAGFYA